MNRFVLGLLLFSVPAAAEVLAVQRINYSTYISGIGTVGVGPVTASLNGGPQIEIVCNDFAGRTLVPSTFTVSVNTIDDLGNARFESRPDATAAYQSAAWLLTRLSETSQISDINAIQFAIWDLFYNGVSPTSAASADWLAKAIAINPLQYDYGGVRILTPNDSTNQEFIVGTIVAIPVGTTMVMAGLGLILIGSAARFASKRQESTRT
jgi:hypothetical protein